MTTPGEEVLDNAVWHALRGPQRDLARWEERGRAARFDPEVSVFSGVDVLDEESWHAQAALVGPGGITILFRPEIPAAPGGWQEVFRDTAWQMVLDELGTRPGEAPDILGSADIDDMMGLTKLTEPGPFLPRTHEMGTYVGIRTEGRLVAMAGERLHPPGYTEVSAVCTHPDAQRRGHGAALTLWVAARILERGEKPFLHVLETNESALRLYERLGFRRRRRVDAVAAIRQD